MSSSDVAQLVGRRGELLAELFLSELGARVTSSPVGDADFLAFFEHGGQGVRVVAVEVKARETPWPSEYPVDSKLVERAAHSNIPMLLLIVDVKNNKIGYAWLDRKVTTSGRKQVGGKIRVPLRDAQTERERIVDRIQTSTLAT
jgi:hypothetical protein